MAKELMIGNLWTKKYLNAAHNLNLANLGNPKSAKITEMYGSLPSYHNPIGSARPDSRLPKVEPEYFEDYVQAANKLGIDINYTLNISCIGELNELNNRKPEIEAFLKNLEDVGVKRVTVAHPIIGKLVCEYTKIPIEVSTIMHVETVGQLEQYKKMMPNIDKICMNVYKNRDFRFLRRFKRKADEFGIIVELMANEFCSIGGIPCYGLYRTSCYMVHSHGGNDDLAFDGFPIKGPCGCITSRIQSPSSYLKARFILPQWYDIYKQETGIEHFKITGRTHTFEQIIPVVHAYASGYYGNDLMKLWLLDKDHADLKIDSKELNNFIDHWVENSRKGKDFPCDELCGDGCKFCDDEFIKICPDTPLHRPELIHQYEGIGIE